MPFLFEFSFTSLVNPLLCANHYILLSDEEIEGMQIILIKYLTSVFLFFVFPAASILNPYSKYQLYRNPNFKNAGNFVTLSDFLSLAKNQTSLSGVMIIVEVSSALPNTLGLYSRE